MRIKTRFKTDLRIDLRHIKLPGFLNADGNWNDYLLRQFISNAHVDSALVMYACSPRIV